MAGYPVRYGPADPTEPIIHELPPLKYEGELVPVRLVVRRGEDNTWRARMLFGQQEDDAPSTAEIFCADSEQDLWEAVYSLREHHLRDLYRSLAS